MILSLLLMLSVMDPLSIYTKKTKINTGGIFRPYFYE